MLNERYQLGDVGLVPRPGQHITSNTEKMKSMEDDQAKTLRRVANKSISTQTASATKVTDDRVLCSFLLQDLGAFRPRRFHPREIDPRGIDPMGHLYLEH